jgi:hypothetical protein
MGAGGMLVSLVLSDAGEQHITPFGGMQQPHPDHNGGTTSKHRPCVV